MQARPPSLPKSSSAGPAIVFGALGWALVFTAISLNVSLPRVLQVVGGLCLFVGAFLTLFSLVRLYRARGAARFRGSHLAALLLNGLPFVLVAIGFGKREGRVDDWLADATRLERSDAEKTLRNEQFRFGLDLTGTDWILLSGADASRVAPHTVAAAMSRKHRAFGMIVVVEEGGALDEYVGAFEEEGVEVHDAVRVRFLDRDAIRVSFTMRSSGLAQYGRLTYFLHQGHGYIVMVMLPGAQVPAAAEWYASFANAFRLLEGDVTSRGVLPTADETGVGWLIREGRFESAVGSLAVSPVGAWRPDEGGGRDTGDYECWAGIERQAPRLSVYFYSESHADPERALAEARENIPASLEVDALDASMAASLLGHDVDLRAYRHKEGGDERLHGGFVEGNRYVEVYVRYAAAERAAARSALASGLVCARFLSRNDVSRLERRLAKLPDPQERVGPDYYLRAGTYEDFERGLKWKAPEGLWWVRVGPEAAKVHENARLVVEAPRKAMYAYVFSEPAGAPPRLWHDEMLRRMLDQEDIPAEYPTEVRLAGAPGLRTLTEVGPWTYRIETAVFGPRGVAVAFWGPTKRMAAERDRVDAVFEALDVLPLDTSGVVEQGSSYVDKRMAFAFDPPGSGWSRKDRTPGRSPTPATMQVWRGRGREIHLTAVFAPEMGGEEEWVHKVMGQMIGNLGETVEVYDAGESTLGGRKCRVLRVQNKNEYNETFLVGRGSMLYTLVVATRNRPPDADFIRRVKAGFRLLP